MAVRLPTTVQDPRTQQCLDFIAARLSGVRQVDALPTTARRGELVYNLGDDVLYCFNGSEWKALY